ncbi:MAG TPA: sulfur carrier protein ThiS adenylyltransferase ThiF, partial [bacterium]|nr:sulfur carrier protein ThiS adenylyltransferase ThiF [bacterium]
YKIGIANINNINSNITMHLARCNYLNFKIVDFDKVEKSNLNRQFYFLSQLAMPKVKALLENLKDINASADKIEYACIKLDEKIILEIFRDCDIVIDGFDKAENKAMLINSFCNSGKYIISACGVAGADLENIRIEKLNDRIFIVGDMQTDCQRAKLYSFKVMCVASIMTKIIFDILKN